LQPTTSVATASSSPERPAALAVSVVEVIAGGAGRRWPPAGGSGSIGAPISMPTEIANAGSRS
jgi:hypothetical protein